MSVFCKAIECLANGAKFIVSLCNNNSGFISAILAVIAILISIKIGRLAYQKKLVFYHYLDCDASGDITIVLYVSNVGSCPVYIDRLSAKEGYFKGIGQCRAISDAVLVDNHLLKPQETCTFQMQLEGYNYQSFQKRKSLRIILKSGHKTFTYRASWAMG